jgi:hypothetical protein
MRMFQVSDKATEMLKENLATADSSHDQDLL